jgi:hypothetical protein
VTAISLSPYWSTDEDWAGFLLVIVPADRLAVAGEDLCRQVRAQIETDAVLYDLVTVTHVAPFRPTPDWGRVLLTNVIGAAMPDRHFFAPRGVIGLVVVASDEQALKDAFEGVRNLQPESRLWARQYGYHGVLADSPRSANATSVMKIADTVHTLIERYDEDPRLAVSERAFLGRVDALRGKYAIEPEPARDPPPDPRPPAEDRARELPAARHAAEQRLEQPERPGPSRPALAATPETAPAATEPPSGRPAPRPRKGLVEPIVYEGVEMVMVDRRTPLQRLMGQNPTDADCLDELQHDGRPVGLVYLVHVPDDGVVSRSVATRRHAIAMELDQAFASVERDALSDRPAHLAVEVLSATNPVQKHGVLRLAGTLTESALPKVGIEYFSVTDTVAALLDAAHRTSRALRARRLDVVSVHFVFLAAMRFPADDTTEEDWNRLLEKARITWIDFAPADRRLPPYPMRPSPFGLHVLTDKEDVVALIKHHAQVLYRYAPPPADAPTREPAATAATHPPAPLRRWPFGRRAIE